MRALLRDDEQDPRADLDKLHAARPTAARRTNTFARLAAVVAAIVALGALAGCAQPGAPAPAGSYGRWSIENPHPNSPIEAWAYEVALDTEAGYGDQDAQRVLVHRAFGELEPWWSISGCESGHSAIARNPSGASGFFQTMLPLHGWRYVAVGFDPFYWPSVRVNSLAAAHLAAEGGTGPWNESRGCWG